MSETLPPSVVMSQLLAGFQLSQALYVVTKLNVPTMLDDGPRTVAELAERSGAREQPLARLIRTLASAGLFRTDGDLVHTTPLGATLSYDHPNTMANVAEMWMETHYEPFGELLHTVRTGQPAAEKVYGMPAFAWLAEHPDRAAQFSRAMRDVTGSLRKGTFDGYEPPAGRRVADIGGADGSVLAALVADRPDRHGIVFDLPTVTPHATEAMAARGLSDRVEVVSGDFFESVPPADVYLLSFVLHDWDDESATRILRTIHTAAPAGARVLIVESVIPEGDVPHQSKMVDLTMLGMLTGRERSADEYATLLAAAGFTLDRILPTPSVFSIVEATAV